MTKQVARRLDFEAPAKVNLGLRITGTRADGYHLIESLFVPIDLADRVSVEVDRPGQAPGEITITVSAADGVPASQFGRVDLADVPEDDRNLAAKAARAYLAALPVRPSARCPSVDIALRKRIPAGAGLGGGSSDAAAVLRALARLLPLRDARGSAGDRSGTEGEVLAALALEIGADVPFFLAEGPAMVTGIGETVTPVEGLPPFSLLIANPGVCVATADVYGLYDVLAGNPAAVHVSSRPGRGGALTPPEPGSTMPALSGPGASEDAFSRLFARPNDLEPAAIRLCPVIARLRDRLHALGAESVGMSGSGATVYGVFSSDSAAGEALDAAGFESPMWARVVRSQASRDHAAGETVQ